MLSFELDTNSFVLIRNGCDQVYVPDAFRPAVQQALEDGDYGQLSRLFSALRSAA